MASCAQLPTFQGLLPPLSSWPRVFLSDMKIKKVLKDKRQMEEERSASNEAITSAVKRGKTISFCGKVAFKFYEIGKHYVGQLDDLIKVEGTCTFFFGN